MSECSVCTKIFTLKKNLYHHMRTIHNISPQLSGKISCPLLCEDKFRTHKELRNHLENVHEQVLESEVHEFHDYETFEIWKKRLEESTKYGYVRRISEKLLSKGAAKTYYICHRSGVYKSHSTGQRKRKGASYKIGSTCPSVMEVSRSLSDGKVSVVFWKTHIGHEADPERTPLRKNFRIRKLEMINFGVSVVLPAAGTGERMGVDTPKQYISIHGKPIICHTVEAFLKIPFIQKVVVVSSSKTFDLMLKALSEMCSLQGDKLVVTEGGDSRHQSIRSGLKALQTLCGNHPEIVVVHDGVRPFFSEDIVCNVVEAAKEHGAAGITCPLVSTVISVDEDGFLDTSLDRNKFKASEMPQAFQYALLFKAYEECSAYDLEHGTECLHIVQKYAGVKAKLIPGTSHLWKVTHRKDIHTAKAVLKENQTVGIIGSKIVPDFLPYLKTSLGKTFKSAQLVDKLNESSTSKFSNFVQFHNTANPYDVIATHSFSKHKSTNRLSIVHILRNCLDVTLNIQEFQKQAKAGAKILKEFNVLVYYIAWEECDSTESFEERAELVTSLLFDSNPCTTGSLFFS